MSAKKTNQKIAKKSSDQMSVETQALAAGLVAASQVEAQTDKVAITKAQDLKNKKAIAADFSDAELVVSEATDAAEASVDATLMVSGLVESVDSEVSLVANDRNCRVNSKGEEECEGGAYWWLGLLGLAGLAAGGGGGGGGAAPETRADYRHVDFVDSTDVSEDTLLLNADNDARTVNVIFSADENYSSDDFRHISVDSSADVRHLNILATSSDDVLLSLDLDSADELESLSITADESSEVSTSGDLISLEASELSVAVTASGDSSVESWWWSVVNFSGDSVSVDVSAVDSSDVIAYSSIVRSASADNADVSVLASNDSSVTNGWWVSGDYEGDSDFVAMSGDHISLAIEANAGSFIGAYSSDDADLAEVDGDYVTASASALDGSSIEATDALLDVTGDSMDLTVIASGDSSIDVWTNVIEADGDDAQAYVLADGNSADGSADIFASQDIVNGDGSNGTIEVVADGGYWWYETGSISADDNVVDWSGQSADITLSAIDGYAWVSSYWDAVVLEGDNAHVDLNANGFETSITSDNDDVVDMSSDLAEVHISASNGAYIAGEDEVLVLDGLSAEVSLSVDDATVVASGDDVIDVNGDFATIDVFNTSGLIYGEDDIVDADGNSQDVSITGVSGAEFSADDDVVEINGDYAKVVVDLTNSNMWADEDVIDIYGQNASVEFYADSSEVDAYSEDVITLSSTGDAGYVLLSTDSSSIYAFDGDIVNVSGDQATVELDVFDSYVEGQDIVYVRGGDSANSDSTISIEVLDSTISADDDLIDVERNNVSIDADFTSSELFVDGSLLEMGMSRQSDNSSAELVIIDSLLVVSADAISAKGDNLELNVSIDPSEIYATEDLVDVSGDNLNLNVNISADISGDGNYVFVRDDFVEINGNDSDVTLTFDGSNEINVGLGTSYDDVSYDHFGTEHGSNLVQLTGDDANITINLHDTASADVSNHVALIDGDGVNLAINVSGDAKIENFSGDDAISFHGSEANIAVNITGEDSEFITSGDLVSFESSYIGGESTVTITNGDNAYISADYDVLYSYISFDVDSIEDIVDATSATFNFVFSADGSSGTGAWNNIINIESESYWDNASFSYRDDTYSYDDVLTLPVEVNVDFTASDDASVNTGYGSIIELRTGESENWNINVNIAGSADVVAYDYAGGTNLLEIDAAGNGSYAGQHSIDISITDQAFVATDEGLIDVDNLENGYIHLAVDDSSIYTDESPYWINATSTTSTVFSVDINDYDAGYWWGNSSDSDILFYIEGEDNTLNLAMQTTCIDDIDVSFDAYDGWWDTTSTISMDLSDADVSGDISIDVYNGWWNDPASGDTHVELNLFETYVGEDIDINVYEGSDVEIGVSLEDTYVDDELSVYATPESGDGLISLLMDSSFINGVELFFDDVYNDQEISMEMWDSSTWSTEISVDGWWNYSDIQLSMYGSETEYLSVDVSDDQLGSTDIDLSFYNYSSVDQLDIVVAGEDGLDADIYLEADGSTVWDTNVYGEQVGMSLTINATSVDAFGEDAWGQDEHGVNLYVEDSTVSIDSVGEEDAYVQVEGHYSTIYLDSNSTDQALEYIELENSYGTTVHYLDDSDSDRWLVNADFTAAAFTAGPTGQDGTDLDNDANDYYSYTLATEGSGSDLYLYVGSDVLGYLDDAEDGYETIIDNLLNTYSDVYLVVDNGTDISIHHQAAGWTYDGTANVVFAGASGLVNGYEDVYNFLTTNTVI